MFCSLDAWSLEITFFLPFLLLKMSGVQFSCMLNAAVFCFLAGIALSLMHPEGVSGLAGSSLDGGSPEQELPGSSCSAEFSWEQC